MIRITEIQRKIAVLINSEPKTIEDINSQLGIGFDAVTREVNNMIKLSLVKKTDDFPTKYKLDDYITNELKKRKEIAEKDNFRLKIQAIIDIDGAVPEVVTMQLNKIKSVMEKESDFTIYDVKISDIIEQDNSHYGYLDVTMTVKDLRALIYFVMFYTPSSIEVLSPSRYDVSLYELQDGLIETMQRTQVYLRELRKRLTSEELDLLTKKVFK